VASQTNAQRSGRGGGQAAGGNRVALAAVRLLIWAVAALLLLGALWAGFRSLQRVFLLENPRFTLRRIEVQVNGSLRHAEIIAKLAANGVQVGETNIHAIDVRAQREALCAHVMVASAALHLRLPDTLVVEVTERVPVARVMGPTQRLLDADGWVLPLRDPEKAAALPVLFGVRPGALPPEGGRVTDDTVLSALTLLRLLAIRPYGRYFDLAAVRVDAARGILGMHLRARGTFRTGAQVLLPAKPMDLEEALIRVEVITRDRARARQETGFIDATYRRNVPVLP
jgi:hypothetical protein